MLRPATPDLLDRLLRAVHDVDLELDTALIQLGILPPLDLQPIRAWLLRPSAELTAGTDTNGHRIVHVSVSGRPAATLRHDGSIAPVGQPSELATA